ncbi:hypothetical protein [Dethiothermospora halolimnae]|uniref:hypothetical protein n=1 Tax=Dethiothermospora halolimnae TaxID=3114390 RepID=UPI003CCB8784
MDLGDYESLNNRKMDKGDSIIVDKRDAYIYEIIEISKIKDFWHGLCSINNQTK